MTIAPQRGAHVATVASAMPEHRIDQAMAVATLTNLFPGENPAFIRQLVERSGVEERYLVPTPEQVLDRKSFTDRNRHYASAAVELARPATRRSWVPKAASFRTSPRSSRAAHSGGRPGMSSRPA